MGFMSFIKGADQVERVGRIAEKGFGSIISGVDKMAFTDEERADFITKRINQHVNLMESLHDESTTRSITRRYMAFFVMGMAAFVLLFSIGIYRVDQELALFSVEAFTKISSSFAVASVIVFFFGSHMIGRFTKK